MDSATRPPPKVFISHAIEDKDRFVKPMAVWLRGQGVDAWYDEWEIGLGERLWERVSTGIEQCQVFLLVASPTSLNKPWVKTEIGAGLAQRLSDQARFIVLALDGCGPQLPPLLRASRYLSVSVTLAFSESLKELLATIHGYSNKPPVGTAPTFASAPDPPSGFSLTRADWNVLVLLCDAKRNDPSGLLQDTACLEVRSQSGLSDDQFATTLEALAERDFLKLSKAFGTGVLGRGIHHARITVSGYEAYLVSSLPNYADIKKRVMTSVVTRGSCTSEQLQQEVDAPPTILYHLARWLHAQGLAHGSFPMGGDRHFSLTMPSVRLRRMVEP